MPEADTPPLTLTGLTVIESTIGGSTVSVAVCDPPRVPVIVAVVLEPTGKVAMPNVAVVCPPATSTLAGTAAAASSLPSATAIPPAGAGPLSVTVPVLETPPVTVVGSIDSAMACGGCIVSVAVLEPPRVAMMTGVVVDPTPTVETVKVAVVWPAATMTLPETAAAALLLARETAMPPVGAGPSSVTVPVDVLPPTTTVGLTVRVVSAGELTVRVAVLETLPSVAVITGEAVVATAEVETVNVAVVSPDKTVTDAGTVAAAVLPLLRDTTTPAAGAGPLTVTVPVDPVPPITAVGLSASVVSAGD